MATQTRDWADVFVDDVDDRSRLERSALFFIPKAFELCRKHSLTVAGLNSRATIARKDHAGLSLAGRLVIGMVFACKQPVSLDSALRFITLANLELPAGERLQRSDIVACAFRLRDPEIVEELGFKPQDLAAGCGLRREVVDAALKRTRITYHDAHAIWRHLMSAIEGRSDLSQTVRAVLTGDESDFIRTDTKGTHAVAVDRVGRFTPRHSKRAGSETVDDAEYVYSRALLHAAPRSGHIWAIEPPFKATSRQKVEAH